MTRSGAPGGFPAVGVIGGGQLARMMQPAAVALGVSLRVLAESPDASAALAIPAAAVGDPSDVDAVLRFARTCDLVTFDHEQVPAPVLRALQEQGTVLHPTPDALRYAQDKLAMRRRLAADVAGPRWATATSPRDLEDFATTVGWPVVAKAPRGGYDGKGVRVVDRADALEDWFDASRRDAARGGGPLADGVLLEERVEFERELAVLVARSPSGQAAAWPVVETVQSDGICTEVIAPAAGLDPRTAATATAAALRIAGELQVTGVLAVEMFQVRPETAGGQPYLVNELAMRPHNSGHWTVDGSVTSQFEQHLRAVLDLPLGDPRPHGRWTVMANVLGGEHPDLYPAYRHVMARDPGAKVHVYGKSVRPGRKVGHVNVTGTDLESCRRRARHAADYLRGACDG